MGLILDISPRSLEKVLYFASYIVLDPGDTPLTKQQLLTETEYRQYLDMYGDKFRVGMGAAAVKELLQGLDLENSIKNCAMSCAILPASAGSGRSAAWKSSKPSAIPATNRNGWSWT